MQRLKIATTGVLKHYHDLSTATKGLTTTKRLKHQRGSLSPKDSLPPQGSLLPMSSLLPEGFQLLPAPIPRLDFCSRMSSASKQRQIILASCHQRAHTLPPKGSMSPKDSLPPQGSLLPMSSLLFPTAACSHSSSQLLLPHV